MVSSQAQHHEANGPHFGPAKCAAQKYSEPVVYFIENGYMKVSSV